MKDSGISWAGMIPANWELRKNKYIFDKSNYKVGENFEEYQLLSLTTKGVVEKDIEISGGKLPASFKTYQRVHLNSIILCLFDLDVSAVFSGLSEYNGMITSAYDVFTLKNNFHPKYYEFYFQFLGYDRIYLKYSKTLRKTISADNFNSIISLVPLYKEQKKIARLLDNKTQKVTKIIQETQKSIKELKSYKQSIITEAVTKGLDPNVEMKDSGIEWIGEIPSDWIIKKTRFFLMETSIKNHPDEEVLSLYRDYGVVPKNSRDDNHNVTSANTSNYKFVRKNDVVINKMKAWQGSIAISEYKGIVSPAYYTFEVTDKEIEFKFLHYALRNNLYLDEYMRLSAGLRVGQWDLNKNEFKNILYPFPNSISEQLQIVSYLDEQTSRIDKLIADKTKVIEELEDYKKSLIYEYVTGKKEA